MPRHLLILRHTWSKFSRIWVSCWDWSRSMKCVSCMIEWGLEKSAGAIVGDIFWIRAGQIISNSMVCRKWPERRPPTLLPEGLSVWWSDLWQVHLWFLTFPCPGIGQWQQMSVHSKVWRIVVGLDVLPYTSRGAALECAFRGSLGGWRANLVS